MTELEKLVYDQLYQGLMERDSTNCTIELPKLTASLINVIQPYIDQQVTEAVAKREKEIADMVWEEKKEGGA